MDLIREWVLLNLSSSKVIIRLPKTFEIVLDVKYLLKVKRPQYYFSSIFAFKVFQHFQKINSNNNVNSIRLKKGSVNQL